MTYLRTEWAEPDRKRLLLSVKHIAAELDIPTWRANEVAFCLDRRFYTAGRFRVTQRSFDALKGLMNDQGLELREARALMYRYKRRGTLPPPNLTAEQARHEASWGGRRRRRRSIYGP